MVEVLLRYSNHPKLLQPRRSPGETRVERARPRQHKLSQRLTPELIDEIADAYRSGTPTTQLTKTYGIGKGGILRILREAGVRIRRQGLTPDQVTEAAERYAAGESIPMLCTHFGPSNTAIVTGLRKAGVQMRRRPGWHAP